MRIVYMHIWQNLIRDSYASAGIWGEDRKILPDFFPHHARNCGISNVKRIEER